MAKPETISDYLRLVEEQIRWKRARPLLSRELGQHLEDQREAFCQEGQPPALAERLAVEEMGDPVTVGIELDRVHRPKAQWGLLCLSIGLAFLCGFLSVYLTATPEALIKTGCTLLLGCGCLLGLYFLDVTYLLRHAKAVYLGALLLGVLSLWQSPLWNGVSYYTRSVVLLYPAVYALWLYPCRNEGWWGLCKSLLGGLPLVAITLWTPSVLGTAQLLFIGFLLLLLAGSLDWFGLGKRKTILTVCGLGLAFLLLLGHQLAGGLFRERLMYFLHPAWDPQGRGYQALRVRELLAEAKLIGQGSLPQGVSFENPLPGWEGDLILTVLIFRLGWLPFLLLMAAFLLLLLWLLGKGLRLRQGASRLITLAVVLTLGIQLAVSVAMNLGWILFNASMPLMVGRANTLVFLSLLGITLSLFRGAALPPAPADGKKRFRWKLVRIAVSILS